MPVEIHPSAVIDAAAELGEDVRVGAHAVVGPQVRVGDGCEIGASAQIARDTTLGRGNKIYPHACVGFDPQDLKFEGERCFLEVGDGNLIREFCTLNRGTEIGGGTTRIGSDNLFMAYTHVAHDCQVGDRAVFVNGATLGGHVEVADDATIGAFSSVHQFCRVGRHAYIGGYSVIVQDALPFMKTVGIKPACVGLNRIGLERKGFSADELKALERATRILLRGGLNLGQALERLDEELGDSAGVLELVAFVRASERGVIKRRPGRGGGRGGGNGE